MRLTMAHPFIPTRIRGSSEWHTTLPICGLLYSSKYLPDTSTGLRGSFISESFNHMQVSNDRLAERSNSKCLIPLTDGNGGTSMACKRDTANSHAIQEKVLQRIATDNGGGQEVLDFMDINTARIAKECQGPNGELWHKKPWDIERLLPKFVPITTASARHFACNPCDNATFRLIEYKAIPWPPWPANAMVDDLIPDQTQSNFSDQLFLLAYRCLLQHISHFRGLIAADDYAANDQRISEAYRSILKARQHHNRQSLNKLTIMKTKYDRRLTGQSKLTNGPSHLTCRTCVSRRVNSSYVCSKQPHRHYCISRAN